MKKHAKIVSMFLAVTFLFSTACSMLCLADDGSNLLKNPGFESTDGFVASPTNGWKDSAGTNAGETECITSETSGYNPSPDGGNYAMTKSKNTSATAGDASYLTQYISNVSSLVGHHASFSVWYNCTLPTENASSSLWYSACVNILLQGDVGGKTTTIDQTNLYLRPTDGKWSQSSCIFFVPTYVTRISVQLTSKAKSGTNRVLWDGADVHVLADVPENLLPNGDMENVRVDGTNSVPSKVNAYTNYKIEGDSTTWTYGRTGENLVSETMIQHDGTEGNVLAMKPTGSMEALSAVMDFGGIFATTPAPSKLLITGYVKASVNGCASVTYCDGAKPVVPSASATSVATKTGVLYGTGKWEKFAMVANVKTSVSGSTTTWAGQSLEFNYWCDKITEGDKDAYFDDVKVIPIYGDEVINGDMEAAYLITQQGNITPLEAVAAADGDSVVMDTDAAEGAYAAKVTGGIAFANTSPVAGKIYQLTFQAKGTDGRLTVRINGATQALDSLTENYEKYTLYYTVPAESEPVAGITIQTDGVNDFYIDAITFKAVDHAAEENCVFQKDGQIITAPTVGDITCLYEYLPDTPLEGNVILYTALYSIDEHGVLVLKSISMHTKTMHTAENGFQVPLKLKNSVAVTDVNQTIKSYLWNGSFIPIGKKAELKGV